MWKVFTQTSATIKSFRQVRIISKSWNCNACVLIVWPPTGFSCMANSKTKSQNFRWMLKRKIPAPCLHAAGGQLIKRFQVEKVLQASNFITRIVNIVYRWVDPIAWSVISTFSPTTRWLGTTKGSGDGSFFRAAFELGRHEWVVLRPLIWEGIQGVPSKFTSGNFYEIHFPWNFPNESNNHEVENCKASPRNNAFLNIFNGYLF